MTDTLTTRIGETHARDASRFMQTYAKGYHAGAFATPTAKELAEQPHGALIDASEADARFVAVRKFLSRDSKRTDFTGRPYVLPKGSLVVTHIARSGDLLIDLSDRADYVMAYAEDVPLSGSLYDSGRRVIASRVTAAAEVINVWGPVGMDGEPYPRYDQATVTRMPLTVPLPERDGITAEVERLTGWDDDFPYYSDGSWSSLSLKGFWPDDPARGVKPTEMPKSWKEENPADLRRTAQWTVLVRHATRLMDFIDEVPWMRRSERVRLLQMSGRGGKGGALGRHTDITDRDSGTRDGQITRFHVPLVTDPAIMLHTWHLDGSHHETHLEAWNCYYLDARKPHAVTNPTGVNRIHLVVDVLTNSTVRDLIAEAHRP